jgi:hypothetical protein
MMFGFDFLVGDAIYKRERSKQDIKRHSANGCCCDSYNRKIHVGLLVQSVVGIFSKTGFLKFPTTDCTRGSTGIHLEQQGFFVLAAALFERFVTAGCKVPVS